MVAVLGWRESAELEGAALQQALGLVTQAPPERNAPCGCGSGAKWKHCCADEGEAWTKRREPRATLRFSEAWR